VDGVVPLAWSYNHVGVFVQSRGADGHLLSAAAWCERVLAFRDAPAL
jgi:hypothetical protein